MPGSARSGRRSTPSPSAWSRRASSACRSRGRSTTTSTRTPSDARTDSSARVFSLPHARVQSLSAFGTMEMRIANPQVTCPLRCSRSSPELCASGRGPRGGVGGVAAAGGDLRAGDRPRALPPEPGQGPRRLPGPPELLARVRRGPAGSEPVRHALDPEQHPRTQAAVSGTYCG